MLKEKNNNKFFVIFLFALGIKNVHSTDGSFNPETIFNEDQSQRPQSKRQITESIQCGSASMGLFPHPLDCSKFMQCDRGRTYIVDCSAGTVFNELAKVCDWPWKTSCGTRPFYAPPPATSYPTTNPQTYDDLLGQGSSQSGIFGVGSTQPVYIGSGLPQGGSPGQNEEEPFHGEGLINIRHGRVAQRPHSQPVQPHTYNTAEHRQNYPYQHHHHHHHHNHQHQHQNPWQTASNRGQTWNHGTPPPKRPEQDSNRIVFVYPDPSEHPSPQTQTNHHTSNDISNKPQEKIANVPNHFPEINLMTSRVGDEFHEYFSNPQAHSKSSAKVFERPIISIVTPQQFLDTHLVSGRVSGQFDVYFVNPKPITVTDSRFSSQSEVQAKQKPVAIDYITLVRKGTPYAHSASHQYPEINLMSPMVGNEFYSYFSHPKPKSTTEEPSSSSEKNVSNQPEIDEELEASPQKGLFHGEPHLNRNIPSPLDNYNRLYYQPARKSFNQAERRAEPDNVLISDNLKELLEQLNEKSSNLPSGIDLDTRAPSKQADVETFEMTGDHKHIQNVHPERNPTVLPPPPRPQSQFPETDASNRPTYHRPDGAYDPNKIYFPGPHSQSHPMQN